MFLVSGIPRASTTLVAKLLSLTPNAFCYAGETHLVSFLYNYFQHFQCHPKRVGDIANVLRQQLVGTMLEAPRYSVSQGAHPGNLIFSEQHVDTLIEEIGAAIAKGLYGAKLFDTGLAALDRVLAEVSDRPHLGEKTPDSIFAVSAYADSDSIKNFVVVREPLGVLRSMAARVAGGDPFSGVFGGGIESNIGLYLDYAQAAINGVNNCGSQLVRFEDLAIDPRSVLIAMYSVLGIEPDEEVLEFSETGGDQRIADRAPMYYQRLKIKTDFAALSPTDSWKAVNLTRDVRNTLGYSDEILKEMGFILPSQWPGPDRIPAALVPMSGFNEPDIKISRLWNKKTLGRWMKGHGKLLAYLPDRKSARLTLNISSNFPEQVLGQAQADLSAAIGGRVRERVSVSSGARSFSMVIPLTEEDMEPMGRSGAYILIELSSSHHYCPMVHLDSSWDQRLVSFHLGDWKLK